MNLALRLSDPEQAHAAISKMVWPRIKSDLAAGNELTLVVEPYEVARSKQQNRYYWGACLREIADQAVVCGVRYQPEAWHELFKRMFLGYRIEKYRIAGNKRKMAKRVLSSTTGLSVKKMSIYLEQVQAYAANDLAVRFSVNNWEQFHE